GMNIDKQDYDFVIEFYSNGIIGLISQWMDMNMQTPKVITQERLIKMLGGSVENMLSRFQTSAN
ncbi:MAG TPA: TetR family transcriptional regulator C-terminal domain-containing protein, partial [Candidatus Limivicinus faecipullorum]|nr:TetR family transcriptional regulator C-terminal domain-containing protein [Candidatus Limivicinus faecipullorum]